MARGLSRMIRLAPAIGVSVAVLLAAACAWQFRSRPRAPEEPPAAGPSLPEVVVPALREQVDEGWTGSRKCAECHAEIWEAFQKHPMGQSAASVLDATPIEDYADHTSFTSPESRTYRVERAQEKVWHHEAMTDADGRVIFDQAVEVQYEIGSGKRGRSYLIDRGGLMTLSPITWYSEGQRWDLSPGYQPRTHQRFDRRVIDGCLVCHVGRLSFDRDKPDRFGSPALFEPQIGCERCHGPGGEHVRHHESTDPASGASDPVVNPARLEPSSREDVCNQCHLQGRRILRYGRSEHAFRPGQRLEDVWTIFLKGAGIEPASSTRAVGQVEQMRESACFRSSSGRLGCTSCHSPHSVPPADGRAGFFDRRCLACHADRGCSLPAASRDVAPAAGSCIACHMPKFPASNVPHTSQTDHRILRDASKPDQDRPQRDDELFDGAEARIPAADLERARGLLLAAQWARAPGLVSGDQLESLLAPRLRERPDDVDVWKALASLYLVQHREAKAEQALHAVLKLRPEHEEALLQLARFEMDRGHTADAINALERFQSLNPWQAASYGLLAQMLWTDGRIEDALAAAGRGIELDPRLVPLRQWLAEACRRSGRRIEAAEQDDILRRMRDR